MDQQPTPNQLTPQPAIPPAGTPPPAPTPTAPTSPTPLISHLKTPYGIIAAVLFLLVVGSIVFTTTRRPAPVPLAPTPTPTAIPTPTPIRQPSAIATQSAFLSLEASVAALTNDLNALSLQDPSLTPPVLDLPLGFKQ